MNSYVGTQLANELAVSIGLTVYRWGFVATVGAMFFTLAPVVAPLAAVVALGGGIAMVIGLILVANQDPGHSRLRLRLSAVVGFLALAVAFTVWALPSGRHLYETVNTPLIVMALLAMSGALVCLHLFWMAVAESFGSWDVAERFKAPMVLGVVHFLMSGSLSLMQAPPALRWIGGLLMGIPTLVMYWSALTGLKLRLHFGPGSE